MSRTRGAFNIEEHIVGKRCENFQALVGTTQVALVAHLIGDVHESDVEPAPALGIGGQMPPVLYPAHLAVGAQDAIAHMVVVALGYLLPNLAQHPLPVVGVHQPREGIAGELAERGGVGASEQREHSCAHAIKGVWPLRKIAKHTAGEIAEELPSEHEHIGRFRGACGRRRYRT